MIDEAPIKWIAKIAKSMPGPICVDSGAYSVQPAAVAPPGTKNDVINKTPATGSSQKLKLFIPRERHVRRADLQRNLPVRKADERRHDRAEHHDQAMHGGELVEELGPHDLQTGFEQPRSGSSAHHAPGEEHGEREDQVQRPDVLVVGGEQPASPAIRQRVLMRVVFVFVTRG